MTRSLPIPRTLAAACDPRRLALLVYDMQVGILSQIADGAAVTAKVAGVVAAARAAGVPVAFTRHLSLPATWMGTFQMRQAMTWQRVDSPDRVTPWFLRDSPASQIVPDPAPRPDEAVFDKITMSAFEGTPLAFALRDLGRDTFAVVGVALEIGIEPTARHATDHGLFPIVVADACGHGDAAAARSLEALRFTGDAFLTDATTFADLLTQPAAL